MSMNWGGGMAEQRISKAHQDAANAWLKSKPVARRRRINWGAIGGAVLAIAISASVWGFLIWAGTRHWKPKQTPPAVSNAISVPSRGVSTLYRITDQKNRYEVGIDCPDGGDPTVVGNFDGMLMVSCGQE